MERKIVDIKKEIREIYGDVDVDYIFCEVLNLSFTELKQLVGVDEKTYKKALKIAKMNAKNGIPLQKIFKSSYFYGRKFYVNNNVLTPRSDTENLCLEVINYAKSTKQELKVLDLCCGSGAIIVTLNNELGDKNDYVALDVSSKALKVAKKNAKKFNAEIKFIKSDMFKNLKEKFDIIVSNPPYIKTSDIETLDSEVKNFDPKISLEGGEDGFEFYKIIEENAKKYLNEGGKIFLEFGINQAKELKKLFEKDYKDVTIVKDYNNLDRILIATRR